MLPPPCEVPPGHASPDAADAACLRVSTYAVGDVQGCWETLRRLLARLDFDPRHDVLWSVGDLVNRGPASLAVLRWARRHDEALRVVLGNHELHLLAIAAGQRSLRPRDTLHDVLGAPERDALLGWLAEQPLLHEEDGRVLVHAGLLPGWSVGHAASLAQDVSHALRQDRGRALFAALADPLPERWEQAERGEGRLPFAAAVLTRLRTCRADGSPCFEFSGPPDEAPPGCRPWFEHPQRRSAGHTIVFGHWAALGLLRREGLLGLDTGCVWGRTLSAVRLDDGALFAEPLADELPERSRPPR